MRNRAWRDASSSSRRAGDRKIDEIRCWGWLAVMWLGMGSVPMYPNPNPNLNPYPPNPFPGLFINRQQWGT